MEAAEASGSSSHQSSNPSAALGAAAAKNAQEHAPSSQSASYQPFAGSGNTLGSASSSASRPSNTSSSPQEAPVASGAFPEDAIQGLIGLGVPRAEAIRLLEAAGGNPVRSSPVPFFSK